MNTSTRSTWIIAGAVVFAGLLIAGGVIFGNTDNSSNDTANEGGLIASAASAADVDGEEFQSCLDSDRHQSGVQDDVNNATEAGGQGTPYSVLSLNNPLSEATQQELRDLMGEVVISEDGQRLALNGAVPYNGMTQIIDTILADENTGAATTTSDDLAIREVTEEDNIRGDVNADIMVVEYSDFKCPYCASFHDTMKQVVDNYEASEVGWTYRHFPIPQLHPQAPEIAQASECAREIGGEDAFWSFADEIFASQSSS